MKATIIIVTRNRCQSLRETLFSLTHVIVPCELQTELVVVDNGSTDNTWSTVEHFVHPTIKIRRIFEPIAGKSRGLNLGLSVTDGEMILSIDDDVRVHPNWLLSMTSPMIDGRADVVAGGVTLAAHLLRTWMTPLHRAWLAETEWLNENKLVGLVGANMAFNRKVLDKVHGFDVHLGGGAYGYGEDQLFALQIANHGYQINKQLDVCVEHHFDEARLTRSAWLAAAKARGCSQAYIGHHWLQWQGRLAGLKQLRSVARLRAWRKQFPMPHTIEGCSESELLLVQECACLNAQLNECKYCKL